MTRDHGTKDELAAATLLDVITELRQNREVSEKIALTLVQILEGQTQLGEQTGQVVARANQHERRQAESEGRIRVLESSDKNHEERISALETGANRPARTG